MMRSLLKKASHFITMVCPLLLTGCVSIPRGVEPVHEFDITRYLGTWYEIARLDHRFERGLSNIHAVYTLRNDTGIDVVNKGYNDQTKKWEEARGHAYFVEDPTVGRLKVSFFGPFYGGYNIIALDKQNYSYAVVCGPDRSYFWILARTPELPEETLADLLRFSERLGFDTQNLIFPIHDQ
jgi:apolipoprotein D and lipocalin family protein